MKKNVALFGFAIAAMVLFGAANGFAVRLFRGDKTINLSQIPSPVFNKMTPAGVLLGKQLFSDTRLSGNNSLSCKSCHRPEFAFSDTARFSLGVSGKHVGRNAMSLSNLAWQPFYMWDGRVQQLEEVIILPITNPNEMAADTAEVLLNMNADNHYRKLSKEAFQTDTLYFRHISYAISQYLRTLVSANTEMEQQIAAFKDSKTPDNAALVKKMMPFASDKVVAITFTCLACHTHDLMFGGLIMKNNGIDSVSNNQGLIVSTKDPNDEGVFKVPTLKNIAFTAPYMHDGRFKTLEEVVEHYDSGIQAHPNLSQELKDTLGSPLRLNLSQKEKKQMVRFLEMFTDTAFLSAIKE